MKFSRIRLWTFRISLGLLAACSLPSSTKQAVLLYNEHSGITSLDPLYARNLANIWAVQWTYEGLTKLNSDNKIVPCLADAWVCDSTGKVWTISLRKGVFFHPNPDLIVGYQLNSRDVVLSLDRAQNHPFSAWILEGLDTLISNGDFEIELHFSRSVPDLPALLSIPALSILPAPLLESKPVEYWRTIACGTGMFRLQTWVEGEKMVLPRFESYWNKTRMASKGVPVQGIAIQFVKEIQSAKLDFLRGSLAFLQGADPQVNDELRMLAQQPSASFRVVQGDFLNTEYLGFNLQGKHPACGSAALRKSLAAFLDVSKVLKEVRSGMGQDAEGRFCPLSLVEVGAKPNELQGQDQRAKALAWLKRAGYNHPREVPPLVLHTDPAYAYFCSALIYPWVSEGFRVRLEVLERSTLKSMVAKGQLDFFRASWIADYPSASNVLGIFHSNRIPPNGPNYSFFKNDTLDQACEVLSKSTETEKQREAIEQIESLLSHHAPVIPLYFDAFLRFERKEFQGLTSNVLNQLDARNAVVVQGE